MQTFWFILGVVLIALLVLCWRYDQRMKQQGRELRTSSAMDRGRRDLRRDARVAAGNLGWSRTAASYTQEQFRERQSRRDARGHD